MKQFLILLFLSLTIINLVIGFHGNLDTFNIFGAGLTLATMHYLIVGMDGE